LLATPRPCNDYSCYGALEIVGAITIIIIIYYSPTHSLFIAQKPRKHGEILGRLIEVGWGKVAYWSTKASVFLKRIKLHERLLESL